MRLNSKKLKLTINHFLKNKDGRTLTSNFIYLTILQFASYIFPIITLPYLSRVIGVSNFGKIAFSMATISYCNTISDWGFNYYGTRELARIRNNLNQVSILFSKIFYAKVFLTVISFFILLILILFVPIFHENSLLLLLTFLSTIGYTLFPEWFFQGLEKMKYLTIFNFLSKLLFTIAIFIFIKKESDYILQPLFFSLGFIVSGLIAMYVIIYRWKIRLRIPRFEDILKIIKNSTSIFICNIMPNFYNSFSVMLLGGISGSVANGIYDAGKKFCTVVSMFLTVIARTIFPYLARKPQNHKRYAKVSITISIVATLFLFSFAPLIIRIFFTPEFYDAIPILKLLSFCIIFFTLNEVYGINYLIVNNHDKIIKNITIFSSIVGFATSFPLIYYFSYYGAAFTFMISTILLGVLPTYYAIRLKKHKI